ncbi:MAG: hypothetical protein Q7J85_13635 [Bacillota bacterium]|nr:hypothetical protein [Bacillota bacterium]
MAKKVKPLTAAGLVVVFCIIIALVLGLLHFKYGTVTNPQSIIVYKIKVEDTELHIRGDTVNSSSGFVGYKYKIENENLYLQLRYSFLTKKNQYGDFNINIAGNFANVNKVYLRGKKPHFAELIWTR